MSWRLRLPVWAALAALVLYFFRAWLGSGLPASPRLEALAPFTYIWQVAQYARDGYLYVDWDPTFFAGYPWLRFLQSTVYYLAAFLSLMPGMSLALALKVFIIATYILSAWTMAELVRTVVRNHGDGEDVAWAAALVAGAVYAVFPFHLHLGIEIISHAAFWAIMPLPLLVYERGRGLLSRRDAVAQPADHPVSAIQLGVAIALYGITDIEHAMLVGPFVALYILLREFPTLRGQWRCALRMLATAAAVALALMAFYVLPAMGEIGEVGISARFGQGGAADAQFARDTGLSVGALLAGAADRLGTTYRPSDLPYIVFGFFGANTWYLGVITLALAVLGLLWLRRSPAAAVSTLLLLLAFAWAARAWLPINLFAGIPFFGTLSGFRGMIHIGFFLSVLAGCGAAWLLGALQQRPAQVIILALAAVALSVDRPRPTIAYAGEAIAIIALAALALPLARRQHAWRIIVAGLLLFLLVGVDFRTASAAVVSLPRYFESDEVDAYAWLTAQGSGFRIWEYSDLYDDAEFLHTFSLAYNQAPRFGGYYDNGATKAQWSLFKWAKPERDRTPPVDAQALRTALRVSAVRYVVVHYRIATFDDAIALLRQIGFDSVAWQTANVTILEDKAWQPMARVYAQSAQVFQPKSDNELPSLLVADQANWGIYATGDSGPLQTVTSALPTAALPAAATMTRLNPYKIAVQTDPASAGLLVLSESWHPNWQATVDGQPARIVRANVAFMGVRLDAGKHDVLYSYSLPPGLLIGWAVSLVTALALAVRAARSRR